MKVKENIIKSYGYTLDGQYYRKVFDNGAMYAILKSNLSHLTEQEVKENCEEIDDIFGAMETRNDFGIPGVKDKKINIDEVL